MNLRRCASILLLLFAVFLIGCANLNNSDFAPMSNSTPISSSGSDKESSSGSKSGNEDSSFNSVMEGNSKSVKEPLSTNEHSIEEYNDNSGTEDNSESIEESSWTNETSADEYIDYNDRLRFFQNYSPEILYSEELVADEQCRNNANIVLYSLLKNNIVMFDIFVWGVGVELLKPNGEPFCGGDECPIICKCDYFDSFDDFYDTLCATYTEECVDHLINNDIFKDGNPAFYVQDGIWCANNLPYSWVVNPFYKCHYEITNISEDKIDFDFLFSYEDPDGKMWSESRKFEAVMVDNQWLLNKMVYNPM